MDKQLPEVMDMDKSLHELCQNSIDLIEYARESLQSRLTSFR